MEDCLFCRIILKEIPSWGVYEDENVYAFLDIQPVHLGHTLVVPKRHVEDIFHTDPETWQHTLEAVRRIAPKVRAATQADGLNLLMNNGRSAGQLIDHVHIHLIPRYENDGLHGFPQQDSTPENRTEMAERIRNA